MLIENLKIEQVEEVNVLLEKFMETNNDITVTTFPIPTVKKEIKDFATISDRVRELEDKVNSIQTLLKNIFGNHILVNGQWVQIKR